jgi:hypothetical protein
MAADMYLREVDVLRFELSMSTCSTEVIVRLVHWVNAVYRYMGGWMDGWTDSCRERSWLISCGGAGAGGREYKERKGCQC